MMMGKAYQQEQDRKYNEVGRGERIEAMLIEIRDLLRQLVEQRPDDEWASWDKSEPEKE